MNRSLIINIDALGLSEEINSGILLGAVVSDMDRYGEEIRPVGAWCT
jgi:hypothetical protein